MTHRFFVTSNQIIRDVATIYGSDVNHIKNVLRLKKGDEIDILDGTGRIYAAKIASLGRDKIKCEIQSYRSLKSEPEVKVTIAQCLPKGQKMDFVVQKCVELGTTRIIPTISERVVVKLESRKAAERIERWRRISKEAAEQSGRGIIPQIENIKPFNEVLNYSRQFDLSLIPWEIEEEKSLKNILKYHKDIKSILVLIGPEGGFSKEEVDEAIKSGFTPVTLGKRILRTETAGIAILSMIMYEFEL